MMTATEFCYWLQGAFDLSPTLVLTAEHFTTIRKYLFSVEQDDEPKDAVDFCNWMRVGLDFIEHENLGHTEMVRQRLLSTFANFDPAFYKQRC